MRLKTLPNAKFFGTVFSGAGQGKRFVELPWVKRQLTLLTGFSPFPGTLNIRLNREVAQQRDVLEKQQGLMVKPEPGYCPGFLYKAEICGSECYIVIPKVPGYPKDVLEVISPFDLRKKFKIKDGDAVTVTVTV